MKKHLENNTGFAEVYNYIIDMEQGETTTVEAMKALGMTGTYHPKPGQGREKKVAVEELTSFLLGGFSNPNARDPDYNILRNNGDGTFTRK
jgi:hypothetical protein